ncbi:hypothetical protein L3Y34_006593 [Caenorhabditis briggsae]|uniref:Glycosyltransferase family 92 protein n=2 Tax=Caenorhabditis briggsae TaxID=6238 RepID=A0AAE9A048_CAEBR|nr:hypothetical protein L3Y34_006593 [Caenorhabditis briggsae]
MWKIVQPIGLNKTYLKLLILFSFLFFLCLLLSFPDFYGDSLDPDIPCYVEPWNQVHTKIVPNEELHWEWAQQNISRRDNILGSEVRLLSAFVYEDYISITTTSQKSYGQLIHCRYFDCNREEIPDSVYQSFFFPMNVVKCPRRVGAKYVSIASSKYAKPQQPIPLIFRAYPSPMHGISVCVGPLYGPEKKWLEIAEFIEHYKLIGVRHFYFTIFNMNEYTRKIMDEYTRTGEVELTVIQSEYANVDWQFHLLQINECHQRAKYHSKWVINADIDERLVMLNGTLQDLIRRQEQSISEINFAVQRVMKTDLLPEVYENDEQILREMIFTKYNISADVVWKAAKCMYRPEKTASMYYHWSYIKYPGYNAAWIGRNQGYFLHYRTTSATGIGSGWLDHANYKNFQERPNPITFANELRENVLRKIKYVYDRRILYCEELPDAVYQEYIVYGHETFHCKFKSEVENEQRKKLELENSTMISRK